MKRFNIVTRKTYKKRDGTEKVQWPNVGSLVYFPPSGQKGDGYALELSMFPDTKFYVFEAKPREDRQPSGQNDEVENAAAQNDSEIPF